MSTYFGTYAQKQTFNHIYPKLMLLFGLVLISLPLQAFSRWHSYTNTNNITDFILTEDKAYSASWGGISMYNRLRNEFDSQDDIAFSHSITSVDGLTSNDIRTLAYEPSSRDLWAGSYNDGITIIKQSGNQILNVGSGLPSNKIRRIIVFQSYIFVATDAGISQFYYLPGVSFPLLLHQYSNQSTQNGLVSNDVRDIAIKSDGWLYCATAGGISYVHTDSLDIDTAWHSWTHSNSPLPFETVLSISINGDFIAANTMGKVLKANLSSSTPVWQSWSIGNSLADSVFATRLSPQNEIYLSYGKWDEDTMTLRRRTSYVYGIIDVSGVLVNYNNMEAKVSSSLSATCVYRFVLDLQTPVFCTWGEGISAGSEVNPIKLENNCIGFQTISKIATDQNNKSWFVSGHIGGGMTRKGTRGASSWDNGNWQNYSIKSSPLTSDNMLCLAIDNNNRKWFGSWWADSLAYGWHHGVNVFDDELDTWSWYSDSGIRNWLPASHSWSGNVADSIRFFNNTISEVYVDKKGNIIVNCSGAGMVAFDKDYNFIRNILLPGSFSQVQQTISIFHSGSRYFFGTNNDRGLIIWNDPDLPDNSGDHWLTAPSGMELNNCIVNGVVTIVNQFGEEQNWIATSAGLIMWDGTNWYKYDTDIKTRIWKNGAWSQNQSDGATWYYADEERIFGSVRTSPSAIFLDPFNRIWIGSQDYGFSMYSPTTERFTNYFKANSPLLSNFITCFGYDPITGNLLIGTPDGLNTLEIGIEQKTENKLETVKAFPNPFYPGKDGVVKIVNLPSESMPKGKNRCKIFDVSGALIIELPENEFAQFNWNGKNSGGAKCSSGIYYFVVSSSNGSTKRGKIALIQQ